MFIRLYLELTHCHWFKSETGLLLARVKIKNGAPRPKLMSNTFEPIALLKYSFTFSQFFGYFRSTSGQSLSNYLTAMSPKPSFATKTDEIASLCGSKLHLSCTQLLSTHICALNVDHAPGMEVPTAMMTNPIVKWLISNISPMVSTHQIIPNEMATIHKIAIVKDSKYHFRVSSVSHGGIVKV